jgi:hypothetical protein
MGTSRNSDWRENPAQPFLRPAFDEKQEEAVTLIGEVLAAGIEKELKKL